MLLLTNAASGSEDFHFLFKFVDPFPIRLDRLYQTIESRVQVVIPRIGKRDGQLRRRMTHKIKILLFW